MARNSRSSRCRLSKRAVLCKRSLPVEAQKPPKTKRASELSFEPKVTFRIYGNSDLEKCVHLRTLLLGLDRQFAWFAPNEVIRGEPDPIEITEIALTHVTFTRRRSVLRKEHLDAYLRHLRTLAEELLALLGAWGATSIEIEMELWTHVMVVQQVKEKSE